MVGTPRRALRVAFGCAFSWALLLAFLPAPVAAQDALDNRRAEAEALQSRIEAQGERLSMANEEYHVAAEERARIEVRATSAAGEVAAAEALWNELKAQLADRVRMLYKYPTAALDAWLGARSFSELERAARYGSEILAADTRLLFETDQARREMLARAERLAALRDESRRQEAEMASRRTEVASELEQQRRLLAGVTSEIEATMEAQRQAEIAEAQRQAQLDEAQRQAEQAAADVVPDPAQPATPAAKDDEEPPSSSAPPVRSSAGKAVATAAEQIGKPYEWGASGPDSFDCSGLTSYAWAAAGVSLPRSSRAQYSALPKVPRDQIQPGDLLFYGNPIHHVGIYEGGGVMINAPQTGETVRRNSINRSDYTGAARP